MTRPLAPGTLRLAEDRDSQQKCSVQCFKWHICRSNPVEEGWIAGGRGRWQGLDDGEIGKSVSFIQETFSEYL